MWMWLITYPTHPFYLFTIDSLLTAVDFLFANVVKTQLNTVSDVPSMRRYMWYCLLISVNYISIVVMYGRYSLITTRLLCALATPFCTRLVCLHAKWFDGLYKKIEKLFKKAAKTMMCGGVAFVTNVLCKEVLNHDCMISRKEIEDVYESYEYAHMNLLVRIFVAVNIVGTIDITSKYFGNIVRMFYNRGKVVDLRKNCGYVDPYPEIKDPKEKIRRIVMSRKWNLFYNPVVLETLIELYEKGEPGKFFIWLKQNLIWIGVIVTQFFTAWTLSYHFRSPWVLLGVSWSVVHARGVDVHELSFLTPFKAVGVLLSCYGWFVTGSAISELSDLLWNRATWWLGRKIQRRLEYYHGVLTHDNSLNGYIVFYAMFIYFLYKYLHLAAIIILLPLLPFVSHNFVATYMLLGIFSGFSLTHMLVLMIVLYLYHNIRNYKTAPKRKINPSMIQSYCYEPVEKPPPKIVVVDDYLPQRGKNQIKN